MTFWGRWVRRPQELFLRRVLFQIHLWTGIGVGVYVLVISVSGSVLVYRNELYRTFSPQPTVVAGSGESIAMEELKSAARRAYPGYEVTDVRKGETANHAVEITLKHGKEMKRRLLHPATQYRRAFGLRPGSWTCTTTCSAEKPAAGSTASARCL